MYALLHTQKNRKTTQTDTETHGWTGGQTDK